MPLDNLSFFQPEKAKEIWDNYSSSLLPRSILFHGPRNSGRLTGALDLSFILTGEEEKRDILRSSDIIFLPHREMGSRIKAALELFKTQRTRASRFFLLESVRLVLMQYHPVFSAVSTNTTLPYFSLAGEVNEALMDAEDDKDFSEKEINDLVKIIERCIDPKFLYQGKKAPSSVSIDQVRACQDYFSTTGRERVVIFEDVEDSTDGAKNSLLKMLEEPKERSHMILISKNPQKLLETILSRVRKFQFPSLGEKKTADLIRKKFNVWEHYNSIDSFFFEKGSGEEVRKEFDECISMVFDSVKNSKPLSSENLERVLSTLEKLSAWRHGAESLLYLLEKAWKEGELSSYKMKKTTDLLTRYLLSTDVYNMGPRMAFDLLLREAVSVK